MIATVEEQTFYEPWAALCRPMASLCLAREGAAMRETSETSETIEIRDETAAGAASGAAARCMGITRAGQPCRRRAVNAGFCARHGTPAFYARALSARERRSYDEALAQEGLAGEVAVLRLHLLRLLASDDQEARAEIPRTVHALARALKDGRTTAGDVLADLDAAIREEGRRWLDGRAAPRE